MSEKLQTYTHEHVAAALYDNLIWYWRDAHTQRTPKNNVMCAFRQA